MASINYAAMERRFFLLLTGLLVAGGVFCTLAVNAAESSGIAGIALQGPISPVERPGQPNVAPLPYAVITVQRAKGGTEIARQVADRLGRFHIRLKPGNYLIVPLAPDPAAILPRGTPQPVKVRHTQFTRVVVHYDTGIR